MDSRAQKKADREKKATALAEQKLQEIGALLGSTTEEAARRLAKGGPVLLRVILLTSGGEVRSVKTVIGGRGAAPEQFLLLHLSQLQGNFALLEWSKEEDLPTSVPLPAGDETLRSFISLLTSQVNLVDSCRLLSTDELRRISAGGQLRVFEHPAADTPSPATSLPGTPARDTPPIRPSSPPTSQKEIAAMDGLEKTDEIDPATGFNVYKDRVPTAEELERRRRLEEDSEDVADQLAAIRGEPRLERTEPDGTVIVDTPLERVAAREAARKAELEKFERETQAELDAAMAASVDEPLDENVEESAKVTRGEKSDDKGAMKRDGGRKRAHDGQESDLAAPPCKRCREMESQCDSLRKEKDELEKKCIEQQQTVDEARAARNDALEKLEKEKEERKKLLLAAVSLPPVQPQQRADSLGPDPMQAQARAAVAASRRVEIMRDQDTVSAFTLRSAGSPLKEGRIPMVAIEEEEEDMDLQEETAPAADEEPPTRETTPVPLRVTLEDFKRNTLDTVQFLDFLQGWMLFEAPFCSVPSLPRYSGGSGRPLAPDQLRSSVLPTSRSWHTRMAKAVAHLIDDLRHRSVAVLESGVCTLGQQRRLEKLFSKLQKALRLAEKVHRTTLAQIRYSDERVRQQNKPRFSASEQMDGRLEKIKRRARKIFNLLKETD